MKTSKRALQVINAGSMADVAFLLLVFFLVTTTMVQETGLMRKLPPPIDAEGEIKKRNVLNVLINEQNQLLVNGSPMKVGEVAAFALAFIQNKEDRADMPEKEIQFIEGLGNMAVPKQVISLQCDLRTGFGRYVQVQDALESAYHLARNDLAEQKFQQSYIDLIDAKKVSKLKALQAVYPMRISEAEPFVATL